MRFLPVTALIVGALVAGTLLGVSAQAQSTDAYVIRAWDDVVKTSSDTESPRQMVVTYDPATHTFRQEAYDAGGALVASEIIVGDVTPSPDEIEAAREIVRNDEQLGELASRSDIRIDGGFIHHDGACTQTRCLQFEIGPVDAPRAHDFVVVDLNAGQILYRDFFDNPVD